jgi:hypothetical protein
MATFLYEFEWDPAKASTNLSKQDFERAATVFLDPLAVTIPDDEHSAAEVRWITMGKDAGGQFLISARRPTRAEIRDYEEHT